jgi:hypothetical protein
LNQDEKTEAKVDFSKSDSKMTAEFRGRLKRVLDVVIENEAKLTAMDAQVGDGDLGIGAARGCTLALKVINHQDF